MKSFEDLAASPERGHERARPGPATDGNRRADEATTPVVDVSLATVKQAAAEPADGKGSAATTSARGTTSPLPTTVAESIDGILDRLNDGYLEDADRTRIAAQSLPILTRAVDANTDVLKLLVDKVSSDERAPILLKVLGGRAAPVLPDLIEMLDDDHEVDLIVDAIVAICSGVKADPTPLLRKRLEQPYCNIAAIAKVAAASAGRNGQFVASDDGWLVAARPEVRAAGLLVKALLRDSEFPLVQSIRIALEHKQICLRIAAVQAIFTQPVTDELIELLLVALRDEVYEVCKEATSSTFITDEYRSTMVPVLVRKLKQAKPPELFYLAELLAAMADTANDPACVLLKLANRSDDPGVKYELRHALHCLAPHLFSDARRPRGWTRPD